MEREIIDRLSEIEKRLSEIERASVCSAQNFHGGIRKYLIEVSPYGHVIVGGDGSYSSGGLTARPVRDQ